MLINFLEHKESNFTFALENIKKIPFNTLSKLNNKKFYFKNDFIPLCIFWPNKMAPETTVIKMKTKSFTTPHLKSWVLVSW